MPPRTVVALFGPTGIGKTAVAIALADLLRVEGEDPVAVSADALQVYRGLQVLTAAPTAAERARLEHRLVGFVPVCERFSVGRYAPLAHAEIDGLLATGRRPIVVGGTGLYLRAALADLDLRPEPLPGVRERWAGALAERGPASLHAELRARDPESAAVIAPTDAQRIVRALELLDAGARPPTPGAPQLWTADTRHPTLLAGLVMERDALVRRIDARVDEMLSAGAPEEVRRADVAGASETARKAHGFRELLAGDVGGMKKVTRTFARRQLTWMRKLAGAEIVDMTGRAPDAVAAEVHARLRAREAPPEAPAPRDEPAADRAA